MNNLAAAALIGSLTLTALAGCDSVLFDPNVARIDAVSIASAPSEAQGQAVFVRLATRFDTTDTEAAAGPFPLALATPSEFVVVTSDGEFEGYALSVEVRRCVDACATSEGIGRATVEPDGWRGSERSVEAGAVRVTLAYRKTSS